MRIRSFDGIEQYRALREEILAAVDRVLSSGRLILGPEVQAFEAEFASLLGGGHSVGVSSGTDALGGALLALGVGPGDEVVTFAKTRSVPSVSAIRSVGALPGGVLRRRRRDTLAGSAAAAREAFRRKRGL